MPLGRFKMGSRGFMKNDEFSVPDAGEQENMPQNPQGNNIAQYPSLLPGRFMQKRGFDSPGMPSGLQRFMTRRGLFQGMSQGMGGPMSGVPVQEFNPQPVEEATKEKSKGGIKAFITKKLGR